MRMKMEHRVRPVIRARAIGPRKEEIKDSRNFDRKAESRDHLQPLITNQRQKRLHARRG